MKLIKSLNHFTPDELSKMKHSSIMDLDEILKKNILASPLEKKILDHNFNFNDKPFTLLRGSPILFPEIILEKLLNYELPLKYYKNSILQYYLLSQIKGSGEFNAPVNSLSANKHFYNQKLFMEDISNGILLDVGCDRPSLSHLLYPEGINYIGLDPSFSNDEFKILGMAEFLPFRKSSLDYVSFNTSLDHILDYHSAIEEAFRVLKPGGKILISTYVWLYNSTLLSDTVHFHHFREDQLILALKNLFSIERINRYQDIKGSDHRFMLLLEGKKNK